MKIDNLRSKTMKGLLTMSASSGIVFIIQFFTMLVLARIFSPSEFGVVSAITIITSYTDIFWMIGLGAAIIQKHDLTRDDIQTAFTSTIVFGGIASLAIYFSAPILANLININDPSVIRVIAISFIINSFGAIPLSLIQREMRFNIIIVKDVLGIVGYTLLAILLGIIGYGVWALVLALLFKYLINTFISWCYCSIKPKFGFKISNFKQLIRFGGGNSLSQVFSVTANQGDYFVITNTMGTYALGIYNRAYQLITVPVSLLGQVIDQVFFPAMSRIQSENHRLSNIYILSTITLMLIYLPISVVIFLFSDEIVLLLLGSQWLESSLPLKILALSMFFRVGYKINDPIFRAKGAVYNRAFIQMIYALMVVLFSLIGAKFGLVGVSIGVSIALLLNYVIITFKTYQIIEFNLNLFFRCVLPIALFWIVTIILMDIFQVLLLELYNEFLVLLFIIIIMSLFVLMGIYIMYKIIWPQFIKEQFLEILKTLLGVIKKVIYGGK